MDIPDQESMNFSQNFACPDCGISVDEVEPEAFLSIIRSAPALTAMDWL